MHPLILTHQLANERTFLAWLRTSLSMVTIGIGIVQLLKINTTSAATEKVAKPVGGAFVALGIMTLIFGATRYYRVQNLLLTSYFPVSQYLVSILVITLFILIMTTLILTFALK